MKRAVDAMVRIFDAHMPLAATQAGGRGEAGADALGCWARSAPGTRPMSAPPRRTSFEPPPRQLQVRDKRVSIALSGGSGGAWQQGSMGETGLRHEIESRGKVGREQEAQARLWAARDAVMRQDWCGRTGRWRECMSVSRCLRFPLISSCFCVCVRAPVCVCVCARARVHVCVTVIFVPCNAPLIFSFCWSAHLPILSPLMLCAFLLPLRHPLGSSGWQRGGSRSVPVHRSC